ncbi:MAG: aldo/keto reductase [Butyrivibrio sp.]|nr:aldo/keto reductase [Butyrivibrio sp.]
MALSVAACGNTANNTAASNDAAAVESSVSEITGSTEVAEEAVVSEEGDTQSAPEETASDGPAAISNITDVADVPLITLNNGVQVPQLGLGTQIQRLEGDASEEGRKLLNDTSHDAVVAALQAGYRHLDTAHGYFNESGVGQGIIDSGVPREEIWVTSKLWPSEFGEGVTAQAIDDMLERLQLDYLDCIYLHHPAGDYIGAWHDLEDAYRAGKVRAIGISNFDNYMDAFNQIMDEAEIRPQIMQIEGHPFAQRKEARELAAQYDMQVECWYPIGHADPELLENETLTAIASAHDKSVVQVILRWHMQEGLCAVPGSTNPDHIQENISIFDFELSDEEMEQIRSLDRGDDGRYFNINYKLMGGFFTSLNE